MLHPVFHTVAASSGIGSGLGCSSSHPPAEEVVVELVRNHAMHEEDNVELEEDVLELDEVDMGVHEGEEGIASAGTCWAAIGGTPEEDAHPDSSRSRSEAGAATFAGTDSRGVAAVGTSMCEAPSSTTPRTQPTTRPQTAAQNRQRPRRAMIAKKAEAQETGTTSTSICS